MIREAKTPDGESTFWIGTLDFVVRYRKGRFDVYRFLPEGRPAQVRDLYIDRAGRVWVATARAGIERCDNPNDDVPVFRAYTTREGLSADSVRSLTEDAGGFIYAGTPRGVDRIDPAAAPESRQVQHFTPADGLPDSEHNVAFRDRNGHLWFGTLGGLAEFDPARAVRTVAPAVFITRVRVRGEEIPLPWEGARRLALELNPDRNQMQVEYAAIDLRSASSIRYQYKPAGNLGGWSEPVETRDLNFPTLPPGRFAFAVRAVTANGDVGPEAALELNVLAVFWRRSWFLALLAAFAVTTGAVLYNYRVRYLLAIERLRTRIAVDLHDDIGASLAQISILSELARRGDSPQVLTDIASLARSMVEEMSDIVWAVNPRHDRFEDLARRMRRFAAESLGEVDFHFDAEGLPPEFALKMEYRRPLYLVFKEAIHNAARHSGAGAVEVRLKLKDSALELTVADDGRGFDLSTAGTGEGLRSIRKRMKELGGGAQWDTAPGRGTRFVAVVPLGDSLSLPKLRGILSRPAARIREG